MPRRNLLLVVLAWLVLFVPSTIWALATSWNVLHDDAYISFRYALHLGSGQGLTWNVGEAPTEGFTNLLLVLLMAPVTRLGADPLLAMRAVSAIAVIGTTVLITVTSRRWLGVSLPAALLTGLVYTVVPSVQLLSLSGMETILFAGLLLAALLVGVKLMDNGTLATASLFALVTFAAYLTRPEGALVPIALALSTVILWRRLRTGRVFIIWGLAAFTVLGLAHLAWRLHVFGSPFPNPYYLKSTSLLVVTSGATSVVAFASTFAVVMLASVATIACWKSARLREQASPKVAATSLLITGAILAALYLAFILRTDTITDIAGRFVLPILPILLILSAPALGRVTDALLGARRWAVIPGELALILGMSVMAALPLGTLPTALSPGFLTGAARSMSEQLATNSQLRLARAFAEVAAIAPARVAYGDAGLVPYESGLPWLDLVGLNDSFLARATDRDAAVDYVFASAPDIVMIPRDHTGGLFRQGHGVLGDYASWSSDARWNDYSYLGTFTRQDAPYDLLIIERTGSLPRAARDSLRGDLRLSCIAADRQLVSVTKSNDCD